MAPYIVLVPVFVIVLIVSFQAISTGLRFDAVNSCIVSVCVAGLSVIGLIHYLGDSMNAILLPYAALAISVVIVLVLSFVCKSTNHLREYSRRSDEKGERFIPRGQRLKREKNSRSIQKGL